jgi:5-(carboxyamino)imidazole ribonucleotide mutase
MGTKSDWETMSHASQVLDALGIAHDVRVMSAHRTPALVDEYVGGAESRGIEVIIAGAGGAAHLAGVAAAKTLLPVLGVPIQSKALNGIDSLLSTVQMPGGIPVGTLCHRTRRHQRRLLAAPSRSTSTRPARGSAALPRAQTQAVLAQSDPRASKPSPT